MHCHFYFCDDILTIESEFEVSNRYEWEEFYLLFRINRVMKMKHHVP
jgi:hypothetical protein